MRSAVINNNTNIVENICVAAPADPSPFEGYFMIGLKEPVYEERTTTVTDTYPSGTTVTLNPDGSITLNLPDGTTKDYPAGTTVITRLDGTVTATTVVKENVMVEAGTDCDIGWVYDPATGTFSAP